MRILQAIAGRPQGGAENFFIRLAVALNQTGVHQKILIRHHQDRAAQLRHAGLAPLELRFGGVFDLHSRHHFRRVIREYRPSIVCTWMSRATALCPPGSSGHPFIHVGRLGGYYNLSIIATAIIWSATRKISSIIFWVKAGRAIGCITCQILWMQLRVKKFHEASSASRRRRLFYWLWAVSMKTRRWILQSAPFPPCRTAIFL